MGALLVGLAVRGCRGNDRVGRLELRLAHVEDVLGIEEAGWTPAGAVSPRAGESRDAAPSADDRAAPCALAKVASYQLWQEALVKAKANASGAEAACSSIWSETRRQACYYAAMSGIRATQAARDAVIAGGAAAHDAVKSVKDDSKNEAIARARSASEAAFAACEDDGGS